MSVRRVVGTIREFSSTSRVWAFASPAEFGQNGDPGPNATKFRKSQRKALREGKTQVVGGLDALNGLLDPSPPSPRKGNDRPPRFTQERQREGREGRQGREGRTLIRRGPRNFEYTGKTVSPPDAYGTSLRLRKITKPRSGTMSSADLDKAIKMVMESPKSEVSTPVWNMLLGTIGREGRLELMWKTFNDMKKRGFKPSSRTYTTLLNAYAGLRHADDTTERRGSRTPPEPRTVSRVSIIHDQAHSYLVAQAAELERLETQNDPEELGLGTDAMVDNENIEDETVDINIGPTNAYLKFLAKYGMMQEMEKVFSGMPTSGPLSPDSITYSTMFSALFDKLSKRSTVSDVEGATTSKSLTASGLWNQVYRQFRDSDSSRSSDKRRVDEDLAIIALKCLSRGDQVSQRQAMQVIDALWPLPRPNDTRTPSQVRTQTQTQSTPLPHLPLTTRAATTIMAVCPKPTDRSHYAHLFLQKPELSKSIDTPFLITAIRAFSETGDVQAVMDILKSYQPRQPNQWPMSVWHDALTAARWSVSEEQGMKNQPDFEAALAIFRRMTQIPPGVEDGEITGNYVDTTPNGKPIDVLGNKWAKNGPVELDAKAMSLFLKTALSRGWRDVQRAMAVFLHLDGTKLLDLEAAKVQRQDRDTKHGSGVSTRQWGVDLCRDVERACERLLERDVLGDEKTKFERLHDLVKQPEQRNVESREPRRPTRSARPF